MFLGMPSLLIHPKGIKIYSNWSTSDNPKRFLKCPNDSDYLAKQTKLPSHCHEGW